MKKIICFMFVILSSVSLPLLFTDKTESKIVYEGLDLTTYSTSSEVEKELEDNENVIVSVYGNYDMFEFDKLPEEGMTKEEVYAIRDERRAKAKEYYSRKNKEFSRKVSITDYFYRYVSEYSPCIEFGFEKNTYIEKYINILKKLADNALIDKIFISASDAEVDEHLTRSLKCAYGENLLTDRTYDGNGFKVGILDGGIIIEDHESMEDIDFEIRDEFLYFEHDSEHATRMASIIANPNGIAPGAKIYSVEASGTITGELDWLVSKDVDIVNMSFGESNPDGKYASNAAYADFIAYTYGVIMVAAVGNNNDEKYHVGNPALGYNVIGVGNHTYGDAVAQSSSYVVEKGPEKPTVCASGEYFVTPGFDDNVSCGTSNSCAVVTGLIVCLLQKDVTLVGNVGKTMAVVVGGARQFTTYNTSVPNGFNEYSGAGAFSFKRSCSTINYSYVNTLEKGSATLVQTQTCYYNKGDRMSIGLVWLAIANGTPSKTKLSDYDLRLYKPDGSEFRHTSSSTTNIEYINEYTAPVSGEYTIQIIMYGTKAKTGGEGLFLSFGRGVVEKRDI